MPVTLSLLDSDEVYLAACRGTGLEAFDLLSNRRPPLISPSTGARGGPSRSGQPRAGAGM